ncbi:hypothetical protein BCR24_01345 [Enterococcus ureilyticus]|uniref:Uncharacterized protein n=1 Tax=Enterococcus ureilyticus TaxID=1131292 RepID=A0A1E5HHB8_9ENTE|nr:hypothetical protein [Enterococcus ureilyticus]MBM7689698.1 hypothetical protein [Enterococcus ureilyticus]OEG24030.1 hypothetical protein BCR24_01345 [Enterococcus ureilyticus]
MEKNQKTVEEYVKEVKRLRGYLLIVCVLGLILFIPLMTLYLLNYHIGLLGLFGLFMLVLFSTIRVRKKVLQIRTILTMECDPKKYVAINLQLLNKPFYNKTGINNYQKYFQALSDYYAGDLVEMKKNLEDIDFEAGTLDITLQYYNLLGNYYKESNDLEGLKATIDVIRSLKSRRKFPRQIQQFYDSVDTIFYRHYLVLTNDKNALTKLFDFLATEKEMLKKVGLHFEIGKLYLKTATFDQAATHFNYVLEHGGETYYTVYAQKMIHQMNEEEWTNY